MPSSVRSLNFGVIGFGKLGLLHAALVNALPSSRLAAVVDTSSLVLNAVRSQMKDVRTYGDCEALLRDGGIDAAVIATPTALHVPIAVACVDAGVPVFVEKPLAVSAAQAQPLVEALRKRPVANMVGYMGRHIDTFRKAKEIVATGAIGRPQMLRSSMYVGQVFRTGKGWRYDKATAGGGVLMTQNSHVIDKLLWMFGDIQEVSGHAASLYSTGVEDHCHAVFRFRSGLLGYMDASWSARHYRTPTIAIHVQGDNGTLDVDDDGVRLFLVESREGLSAGWSTWRKPDLYQGVTIDVGGPQYTDQLKEFLAAVRDGRAVSSDVASAVRTQAVIDAVYKSAQAHGAPVKPPELIASRASASEVEQVTS